MLSSCLLSGLIISAISTGIYSLIVDNKKDDENNYQKRDKKMDYCIIFSIIMIVAVFILFFTNMDKGEAVTIKGGFSPKVNNLPPF